MAEFTKIDLRNVRDSRKMPRWKLAMEIGVSEDTITRWENPDDTAMPTPEDVDRIGEVLGDPTIWHRWMLSNYDSYRKRYINTTNYSLPLAVMRVRHELDDVLAMQNEVERDAITGSITCPIRREKYRKETGEAIAALNDVYQQLK